MTALEVPRPDLVAALLARTLQGSPLALTGPPGAGKTTLLLGVAESLTREGWIVRYLDLLGAASSPERFVTAALRALPAESFGGSLSEATEIRRLADSGRSKGAQAVEALFNLWAALDRAGGRPVALLFDEATEIRSLAYFSGLREVHKPFASALGRRPRGTLLATSFPTLARKLWPTLETLEAGPLVAADLAPILPRGARDEAQSIARASFGWPQNVRVLLECLANGEDLVSAWAREMAPGGRLERACRHTYETLLLRSRGYGMSKAVLAAVADEEGLNLTALVARLGRTPGAVRDYLQWLVAVDALRMVKKRYYYVDGMVQWWVRLHARGTLPGGPELLAAAREAVGAEPRAGTPSVRDRLREPQPGPALHGRDDSLMEID